MKKFLKNGEIELINGGYLSTKDEFSPVTNDAFVKAQKHMEYIVTFAKHAEGKDFKGKKADSLEDLKKAVTDELATKDKVYVEKPAKVEKKLAKQLADEAMAFMDYEKASTKVDKVNKFLQQFNIVSEFEEFGLFFEDGIVKLNKIYTLEEVVEAVNKTIDLLD